MRVFTAVCGHSHAELEPHSSPSVLPQLVAAHRAASQCLQGLLRFLEHAVKHLTQQDYNQQRNVWDGEELKLLLREKCQLTADTFPALKGYTEDVRGRAPLQCVVSSLLRRRAVALAHALYAYVRCRLSRKLST